MNKQRFLRERQPVWQRFEELIGRANRLSFSKMPAAEVAEFSRLFRELSHDLATIRSREWGRQLIDYLNDLVARGHNAFYAAPPGNLRHVLRFLAVGYPRLFRSNVGYFFVAAVLLFLPGAISWAVIQIDPSLATRVIDPKQLEKIDEMYSYDPDDADRTVESEQRVYMHSFYISHNVGISLRAFAGGLFLGSITVYVLLSNGISIGAMGGYIVSQGHGRAFTSFVIGHGSFELTAIAVAGGAGLILGNALLHPGRRTRLEALRVRGADAVQIAGGAAAMLVIAAAIEAYWSPSRIPVTIKYVVGTILWGVVIGYLSLAGRGAEENS